MATEVNPLRRLEQFVAQYPTQQAAAKVLGITPVYLSDLLRERRSLSINILAKLGLKRAVVTK